MQQFRCSPHLRLKPELLGVALLLELCGISANFAVKIFPCARCQQEAFNRREREGSAKFAERSLPRSSRNCKNNADARLDESAA
jgi:hypothetical protein